MELYQKIQVLRRSRGLTQAQLAEALDVTRQAVQKWETGLTSPDIYKIPEIAKLFEVSTDCLLDNKITEKELLTKTTTNLQQPSKQSRRSLVEYLLAPVFFLSFYLMIFMFYLIGGSIIGISFLVPIASFAAGVYGIVLIVVNLFNGFGALLVSLSILIGGLGLILPSYWFARWFFSFFIDLSSKFISKIKKIKILEFLK